jgi:hypothetical protein
LGFGYDSVNNIYIITIIENIIITSNTMCI